MEPDSQEHQRPDNRQHEHGEAPARESPQPDVHQNHSEQETRPFSEWISQRWQALSAWSKSFKWKRKLDIFDGLLALVAILSYMLLNEQSNELRRQNNISLNAQRAWVGPDIVNVEPWKPGEAIKLSVHIKNSGPTPAFDVTALGRWARKPKDWVFAPDFKDSIERHWGVLQPQAGGDMPITAPIRPEEIEELKLGTSIFYFWGRVDYKDVMRTEPRWTTFCYVVNPEGSVGPCDNDYSDAR